MKIAFFAIAALLTPALSHAYDLCQGEIYGTWGYKGGRQMTLVLNRVGGDSVHVIVNQENGSEVTRGRCIQNYRNGAANLSFRGQFNSGSIRINQNGYASGSVSGYSFQGRLQ